MNVGELIKKKRQALGLTQKQIADFVGVSEGTVSRWESGNIGNMRRDRIAKLAEILHVSPTLIMGIDENNDLSIKNDTPPNRPEYIKRIPILGRVVAGTPEEAVEYIEGYEEIDTRLHQFRDGEFFALRVKGASMEPVIMDGDLIIVKAQKYVQNRETAVVLINGDEATVKVVREAPDGIMLIGHNTAVYEPHFYSRADIDNLPVTVVGKVVELRRQF